MFKFKIRNADLPVGERVEDLREQFASFHNAEATRTIVQILESIDDVKLCDFESPNDFFNHFNSRSGDLHRFSGEKGLVIDSKCAPYNKDMYDAFYELGFIANNHADGLEEVDVLAILGGGFNANYDRTAKGLRVVNTLKRCGKIIALSTYRTLADAEKLKTAAYSSSETEFGVLTDCLQEVFGVGGDRIILYENTTDDLTTSSKIIRFSEQYKGRWLESYSAPKTNPEMLRANTKDTFKFYFNFNEVFDQPSSWLLVTSNIYTPVQILQFIDHALEYKVNAQIVGNWENDQLTTPESIVIHNYVNELSKVYSQKALFEAKYAKLLQK